LSGHGFTVYRKLPDPIPDEFPLIKAEFLSKMDFYVKGPERGYPFSQISYGRKWPPRTASNGNSCCTKATDGDAKPKGEWAKRP